MTAPAVLVVRHGPGRGRLPGYMQPFFEHLRTTDPPAFAALGFWETGSPRRDLAGIRAVLFLLADPLRETYPDCWRDAAAVADDARSRGIRVANPPEALSLSVKSVQSRIWRDAGIPTPPHEPFASLDDLETAIARTSFPAILRGDEAHCQRGAVLCRTADDARAVPPHRVQLPGTLTPFVDTRHLRRGPGSRSPWARHYHKKRAWVLGRRVRAHHLFFSEEPIVGLHTATLTRRPRKDASPVSRMRVWLLRREAAREDLRFAERGAEHEDVLLRAADLLGLSWVAFDYATTADGQVVIWEANPYPNLNALDDPVFAAQRRRPQRLRALFDDMAAFVRDLGAEGRAPATAATRPEHAGPPQR